MKKVLFSLVGLMFTMTSMAQFYSVPPTSAGIVQKQAGVQSPAVSKAPKKIDLPGNQKIMGNYVGDALPTTNQAYSLGNAGTYPAATIISPSVSADYKGGKVVAIRFATATANAGSRVFITPLNAQGQLLDDAVSVAVENATSGWNTVELETPYEIDGETTFFLGFDYVQKANTYAFFFVGDVIDDGAFIYGNFGTQTGWYNFSSYGQVAVQAIVESDNYPDYDIVIDGLDVQAYVKGTEIPYTVTAHNFGVKPIDNYSLTFFVDNEEIETVEETVTLEGEKQNISGTLSVDGLSIGKHTFTVKATLVEGEAPAANTDNDDLSAQFLVYDLTKERTKHLVEHFTSSSCTYCPLGINMLEKLQALRPDLEWVSIHGTQNSNYPDPYTFNACDDIFRFMGAGGWPSATFNRMYIDDVSIGSGLVFSIGYYEQYAAQVAAAYSDILDKTTVPTLTTVDITGDYDSDTRLLNIRVKGEGVENASSMLADAKLTVYVVEDGLTSRQLNQGTWVSNFSHNNVLRQVLTASKGNSIKWENDAFSEDFSTVLNENWNADNMRVVAFVAFDPDKAENPNQYAVLNTNSAAISVLTGITTATASETSAAEAYYTIDGRRLTAPQRGVNIIRKADGTSKRVVVE